MKHRPPWRSIVFYTALAVATLGAIMMFHGTHNKLQCTKPSLAPVWLLGCPP